MSLDSDILSVLVRLETDKPVRKTPYQVKGILIRDFPDEPIIPFINGNYRFQHLYPRIQVKILNEQIHFVGIKEGVEPILSLVNKLKAMDFGNISFEVKKCDVVQNKDHFTYLPYLVRYQFLTPWVALNEPNMVRYKYFYGDEKTKFITRLLSQNIAFLAKEIGITLENKIFSKLNLESLYPRLVDNGKLGSFEGEFFTNFLLPNFLGIGNGITKGYGVIYTPFNPPDNSADSHGTSELSENGSFVQQLPDNWEAEGVSIDDIPKSRRERFGMDEIEENNFNKPEFHSRTHHH